MKFFFTALSVYSMGLCFSLVSASAEPSKEGASLWIRDLSSEEFKVREKASRELWRLGKEALPALREALLSNDPEVSMRAKEAIDKVELRITENTPEAILSLIDAYRKAPSNEKLNLLNSLKEEKAYFQLLKLYSMEDAEEQNELASAVKDVALMAAREAIVEDDVDEAIDLLRMAPPNHSELMALASLYRSMGQLEQQLATLAPPQAVKAEIWKGYLLRAKGDLYGAIENAEQTNQPQILAGLKVLQGDPIPWLLLNNAPGHRPQSPQQAHQSYVDIALKRWRGEEVQNHEFEPLLKSLTANSRLQRNLAMGSLVSLGKFSMVEEAQNKENPLMGYLYYLSREEIDKSLKVLGLDPKNPNYKTWVNAQFGQIRGEEYSDTVLVNLSFLAAFMEKRGLEKELDEAYSQPLTDLRDKAPEVYRQIISTLFNGDLGAPEFTIGYLSKWAGDDEERWGEVFSSALGDEEIVMEWLGWIREIDPKMKDREALEAMMAIFKASSSPGKLRETWMNRVWEVARKEKDKEVKLGYLMRIMSLCMQQQDVMNTLKAWDMLDEEQKAEAQWGTLDMYLTAAGRWVEAANILLKMTEGNEITSPDTHAHLAATLRRGGMAEKAQAHDEMAEKLALGSAASSMRIGGYYVYSGDFERADIWFRRAALEADPTDAEFLTALEKSAEKSVRIRNWKLAAACHEVIVHIYASQPYRESSLSEIAKGRMNADLARAMSILPENKQRALQTLKSIHRDFMPDGALADDFFPALREAGLNKELDEWFAESWELMVGVIEKYPKSHNSRNTAAWFASRARINLSQAEKYLTEAIHVSPEQAAYLDTMAELKFAQGDRKAALEWSERSVCFAPFEDMIRFQHERFRTSPLPKN